MKVLKNPKMISMLKVGLGLDLGFLLPEILNNQCFAVSFNFNSTTFMKYDGIAQNWL